jgi:hypothetical protein
MKIRRFDRMGIYMRVKKARLDLIPPEVLYALAEAFENGAKKYGERDWELGTTRWTYNERLAAAMRHITQFRLKEDYAKDSKIHHMAHALADLAMVYVAYIRQDIGIDDRY